MPRSVQDFVSYLLLFYGPNGMFEFFDGRPLTREEAEWAFAQLQALDPARRRALDGQGFEGDSIDREMARDLVLGARGVPFEDLEYAPTFSKIQRERLL